MHLTPEQKKAARKELAMYLGKPPYDVEEARRLIATGLLEQQTAAKYGIAPIELIREISKIVLTEPLRKEALRELTEHFGKLPVSEEEVNRLFSSGMLERQILTRYLMPLKELMNKVGFRTVRHSRGRIAMDIP
jgi:hypothetical protein